MAPAHKAGVFFKGLVEPFGKDYMVKFKCKHTGNIFTFTMPHDIKTMREHPEYVEVKEEQPAVTSEDVTAKRNVGRPPKHKEKL